MLNAPDTRLEHPSAEHRCHLWKLQDRIDLAHQSTYCLTGAHKRCPWLSVPPAGERPADRTVPKGKLAAAGGALAATALATVLVMSGGLGVLGRAGAGVAKPPITLAATAAPEVDAGSVAPDASKPNAHVLPLGALTPSVLTALKPESVVAPLSASTGGTV
ncbi:MAG TPA: hypothetical protein VFS62_14420, partial [Chloroflexota bacterium]|nr:hypothetical protein [Chloroflexota bacterium]